MAFNDCNYYLLFREDNVTQRGGKEEEEEEEEQESNSFSGEWASSFVIGGRLIIHLSADETE